MKPSNTLTFASALAVWVALFTVSLQPNAIASGGEHGKGKVTFTRDIAPILNANCVSCHRQGEIAPFSLGRYADVRKRAKQVLEVTESRFMPPWHAESNGEFVDEHRLSPDQISTIKTWVSLGTPEGSRTDMPAPPVFPKDWSLGKPDMVVEASAPYTMAAEGGDVYRCFVLPTSLPEDRYVAAIEVHPGNNRIVHHVIAYLDSRGQARKLEQKMSDGQPGYVAHGGLGIMPTGALGGWAPGNLPHLLPDGVGSELEKGVDIVLQIHYHASVLIKLLIAV